MKKSKWLRLKEKYPLLDMEYAVVKEFEEEDKFLIEKTRLDLVINGRQNDKNGV